MRSEKPALCGNLSGVLGIGFLRRLQARLRRDRYIPPSRCRWVGPVQVSLNMDHRGMIRRLGLAVSLPELLDGTNLEDINTPRPRVSGNVKG